MSTFYQKENGPGSPEAISNREALAKIGAATAASNKRDILGNPFYEFSQGTLSLEDALARISGSPASDPTKGPQIDYGAGKQNLTPEQQAALNGGKPITEVSNMGITAPAGGVPALPNTTAPTTYSALTPADQSAVYKYITTTDFNTRANEAAQLGIQGYRGTADQNAQLYQAKFGKSAAGAAKPPAATPPAAGAGAGTPPAGGTGAGTGTPQPAAPPPVDFAGQIKSVLAEWGVKPPDPNANPVTSFMDNYNQLYTQLGLPTVKSTIDATIRSIADLDKEMADKIAEVNNNPWDSESLRSKKVIKLQDKYEARKAALNSSLTLFNQLYDRGRQDAQFVSTQANALNKNAQDLNQDLIFKAIDSIERTASAQAASAKDEKATVNNLIQQYPDAGIKPTDDLATAAAKASQSPSFNKKLTSIGGDTFSNTQTNSGASIAGLPIAEFDRLDPDTKNFFVNNAEKTQKLMQQKREEGEEAGENLDDIATDVWNQLNNTLTNNKSPMAVREWVMKKWAETFPDAEVGVGSANATKWYNPASWF